MSPSGDRPELTVRRKLLSPVEFELQGDDFSERTEVLWLVAHGPRGDRPRRAGLACRRREGGPAAPSGAAARARALWGRHLQTWEALTRNSSPTQSPRGLAGARPPRRPGRPQVSASLPRPPAELGSPWLSPATRATPASAPGTAWVCWGLVRPCLPRGPAPRRVPFTPPTGLPAAVPAASRRGGRASARPHRPALRLCPAHGPGCACPSRGPGAVGLEPALGGASVGVPAAPPPRPVSRGHSLPAAPDPARVWTLRVPRPSRVPAFRQCPSLPVTRTCSLHGPQRTRLISFPKWHLKMSRFP